MSAPTPGTFIRPVGRWRYGYCLEVKAVVPNHEGHTHMTLKRWGITAQKTPTDDGHRDGAIFWGDFHTIGSSAWRIEEKHRLWSEPIYYKRIETTPNNQQQDLFV